MPERKLVFAKGEGEFGVEIFEAMCLIDNEDFPGNGSEFGPVVCHDNFRSSHHHRGHPRSVVAMGGALVEVNRIGSDSFGPILRIGKFVFAHDGSIFGGSVIDNGVEAGPSHEFSLPMCNGGKGDHDQERSRSMHFGHEQIDKGCCLQGLPLRVSCV